MRSLIVVAVVAIALASSAFAPSSNTPCWRDGRWVKGAICRVSPFEHCAKGKPCGGKCIAKHAVCHVPKP